MTAILYTLRLCECGEWTYSPTCGPCRRPAPPMPATAITVPGAAKPCGCLVGDDCRCPVLVAFSSGSALYGGRWSQCQSGS
jgi:hypothetical protein